MGAEGKGHSNGIADVAVAGAGVVTVGLDDSLRVLGLADFKYTGEVRRRGPAGGQRRRRARRGGGRGINSWEGRLGSTPRGCAEGWRQTAGRPARLCGALEGAVPEGWEGGQRLVLWPGR